VDAAARVLHDKGAQAVTTRAVAHAAGVQAPTIYRLFGDKDGLIDAVAEHVMATYVAAKSAETAQCDDDPVADLRRGWHMHVQFGLANPELYALLNTPGRVFRSPATTAGIDVLRARVRRIAAAGLLRVDEQRALDMIHAAGAGAVLTLLNTPAHERDLSLAEAMFEAVTSTILDTEPVVRDPAMSTVAIMFATLVPDLPALTEAERTLLAEWVTRTLNHLRQAG
jgi:AcrR family transcriptional regulator